MQLLSNLIPGGLSIKVVAIWIGCLAFIALAWSWNNRGHEVEQLSSWQNDVTAAVSAATVAPDSNGKIILLKPQNVLTAIGGLKDSYASAKNTITTINARTTADKKKADEADKKLAATILQYQQDYSVANKKITMLENRPPVAPDRVCPVIEDDTKSAWGDWK